MILDIRVTKLEKCGLKIGHGASFSFQMSHNLAMFSANFASGKKNKSCRRMKHIAERLRHSIFWSLDALRGGTLKKHFKDIQWIMENFDSAESVKRRRELLIRLLKHASETTQFYGRYAEFQDLGDFPVVDKEFIRDHYAAFQSHTYRNRPKRKVSTSGSSGTPFQVFQNRDKVLRNRSDTLYFQGLVGYKIGYRLYYIRKWLARYTKHILMARMQNIEMVNVADFSETYLKRLMQTLRNDTSTKVLLSYASALRDICQYLDDTKAEPVRSKISAIISMAEKLGGDTREKLKHYFNAPVYSRYSNQENGILSLQLSEENQHFQINWASYYIEILHPEKDVPVPEGTLGRVVVTDLFNYCMPLVRYDTGDLAVMTKQGSYFGSSSVFARIEGRKLDVLLDTQGNVISGFNVHEMESYPEVKQFQFIQEDRKKYLIKVVVSKPLEAELEIIAKFKSFLGADADIALSYEEEISQLESGKRRLVVNRYLNKLNI